MIVPAPESLVLHTAHGASRAAEEVHVHDDTLGREAYRLTIGGSVVTCAASSPAGRFYAGVTLERIRAAVSGPDLPALTVLDSPRFGYRGAMLDLARHFLPVEDVLAFIDDIAALKINHLHLHLTDDQGWRLQIDSWPELTRAGAATQVGGGGGGFLTKADYRRIQDHAAARFVTVVPEIDLPGHTNAALVAYPELVEDGVVVAPYEGIEVGFSSLAIHGPRTYEFVADVLAEVAEMTDGPYLHIGGDECLRTSEEDYLAFVSRATAIAAGTGKTVIGWHEMGRSRELPPGTVGQYWNLTTPEASHAEHARSFIEQGGSVILSPGDVAYLDHKYRAEDELGLAWANGPTTLAASYGWEPTAIIPGLDESAILGLEAPIFTETVTTLADLRRLALPRLAAFAEIAWSPRPADGRPRDLADLLSRLPALGREWDAGGVTFERLPEVPWTPASEGVWR